MEPVGSPLGMCVTDALLFGWYLGCRSGENVGCVSAVTRFAS